MARKNEPYIYKVLRRETPNPRQQAVFRAEAANIAYGGARGGGHVAGNQVRSLPPEGRPSRRGGRRRSPLKGRCPPSWLG